MPGGDESNARKWCLQELLCLVIVLGGDAGLEHVSNGRISSANEEMMTCFASRHRVCSPTSPMTGYPRHHPPPPSILLSTTPRQGLGSVC